MGELIEVSFLIRLDLALLLLLFAMSESRLDVGDDRSMFGMFVVYWNKKKENFFSQLKIGWRFIRVVFRVSLFLLEKKKEFEIFIYFEILEFYIYIINYIEREGKYMLCREEKKIVVIIL